MSIKQNVQAQIIMKQIDKSTSKVVKDDSDIMYINSTNNVWFNISFNNNDEYWYSGIYLKIKVFQTTAEKVTMKESTDIYLNMSEDYPVYQLKEGNDTYLYIDLTYVLMNSKGEASYFSLMTTSGSVGVYTDKATLVNRPSIDLMYIKENEYHKKQQNISGSSNGSDQYSVNIRNKRLKYSVNLFEEKNSINPLILDLQYSQEDVNEPGLIGKWRFNYYQTIRSIDGNKYIYTDANNDKHTFVPVENTSVGEEYKIYCDQGGTYLIMKIDRTGTQGYFFEITDEKRIRLLFNNQGNLIKRIIKIKSDKELVNEVTYDSNGKITNIKSSHGYQVGITYSDTTIKLINSLNEETTITLGSSSITKINNKGQTSNYVSD